MPHGSKPKGPNTTEGANKKGIRQKCNLRCPEKANGTAMWRLGKNTFWESQQAGGPHPLVTNVTKTWLITNTLYTVILSFCAKTGMLLSFDSQSHSLHIPLVDWTMCLANAVRMCSWASPSSQSCQSKKSEPPRGARPEQRTRNQSSGQEPGQESRQRKGRADNQ